MGELNLDAKRAEANREPHKVTVGGEVFLLPARIPIAAAMAGNAGDVGGLLRALLGDQLDAFLAAGVDDADFEMITTELYGVSLGESLASGSSSPNTGTPSRPISSGTTASS